MSVELKEFHDGNKTFLAVGYVEYQEDKDSPYYAKHATGQEDWFNSYERAFEFISEGLTPPRSWTLEQ